MKRQSSEPKNLENSGKKQPVQRLNLPPITQEQIVPGAVKQRHLVPSPAQKGDLYYGLDGNTFANISIGNEGDVLTVISGIPTWIARSRSGTVAALPSSGRFLGDIYISTDTPRLYIWNGSAWKYTALT